MCYRFLVVLVFIIAAAGATYASPCETISSHADAWVAKRVDALVKSAHAAYVNNDLNAGYDGVLDNISYTIRRCQLLDNTNLAERYPEFIGYIEETSWVRKPGHQLGFNVPDKQYFAETARFVQIPDYLLERRFLRWVSRAETLERAKAYLRGLNHKRDVKDQLIFFSYRSRHLGTPDNNDSYLRLLVVVPGDLGQGVPERWVQFGVTDRGERVRVRNVSVVSALAADDETYNAYFKDYFRTYLRDGSIRVKGRWELGEGDDSCVKCHKSGVLPIFPVRGSVKADEQDGVDIVNARFRGYGSARFDKYFDATKLGPGLSAVSEEDRRTRFADIDAKPAVAHAMSCSSCHNADGLGSFNWPMDDVILSSFVRGGRMPRGQELSVAERADLYRKLITEYFATSGTNPGILKSWLLGKNRN
jgi:hypothetical protein